MLLIMLLIGFFINSWAITKPLALTKESESEKENVNTLFIFTALAVVCSIITIQVALNFDYLPIVVYLYMLLVPLLVGVLIYLARKKVQKNIFIGNLTIFVINNIFFGYFIGLYLHP